MSWLESDPSLAGRRRHEIAALSQNHLARSDQRREGQPLGSLPDLAERGVRRGNADVAIARVPALRERRPGRHDGNAGGPGQLDDPTRAAIEHVEVDEVPAVWIRPCPDAGPAEQI